MAGHAFVLHLLRATARRENAHALLARCGTEGEIWPAVDGRAMTSADLDACANDTLFTPAYPFGLKTGEIGCFLSHRRIWAEIVRRDLDYGLIFEDDVAIDPGPYAKAVRLAVRHAPTFHYIQLQNRPPERTGPVADQDGDSTLRVPVVSSLRASAQLVTRTAAAHLLALSEIFDRPVDTFVQSHWQTGLRPAAIYPAGIATISDQLDGSTIQSGKKTLGQRLYREVARGLYRARVRRCSAQSTAPRNGGLT